MEPEGLLLLSLEASTGFHPEPDRPSPYQSSYFSNILLNTIHLPPYLFPSGLPNNSLPVILAMLISTQLYEH
jgi:hypothetical protein